MSFALQQFSGKERDTETNLDYFGARYFSGAQGRFTSPDPKIMTARHLMSPQKWNKYAYVQNNPLASIDPDGLDDYKVFITDLRAGGDWAAAKRSAESNGHTMQIYRGGAATIQKYNAAIADPNSRVVFVGHSSHDPQTQTTTAVILDNGRSAGANSVVREIGPTDASGVANSTEALLPTINVSANSVGIFACSSSDLSVQYPGASFVGVDSGTDRVTSVQALGPAAAGFVTADAAARPANGPTATGVQNPVDAANEALKKNAHTQDVDGDRVKQR